MFEKLYELAPVINAKISQAKNILVNIHVGADFDSICSALAMKNILASLDKEVTVFSPEAFDTEVMANAASFAGFSGVVFKKFSDFDLKSFDLFLCLDCDDPVRVTRFDGLPSSLPFPIINIDHHVMNKNFGDINLVVNHTCTSELIYILAKTNHWEISTGTAKMLLTGIWTDSLLLYPDLVSVETYRSFSDLGKLSGVDIPDLIWHYKVVDEQVLMAASLVISRAEKLFSGQVILASISDADLEKYDLPKESMTPVKEWVAHNLSYTRQSAIVVVLVDRGDWTKVSLRSNNLNNFRDVSVICRKIPGGGGHPHGSGAESKLSLSETKKLIISLIRETYPDLGTP